MITVDSTNVPAARQLETIQEIDKLNDVYSIDNEGPGGAHHKYQVMINGKHDLVGEIFFQCGPRNEEGSESGVIDSDLLEIVRDRLRSFQNGPFKSSYNERALFHIEEALAALNDRVKDRHNRGVLGTYNK